MKKSILLFGLILIYSSLFGQEWVNKMLDQNVNFYEVQDAFYEHWQGKGYERGKGYKQFKRWESLMAPRVYPTGNRIRSKTYVHAWREIKKMQTTMDKSGSEWEPLGPTDWVSQGWNPGLGRVNSVTQDPADPNTLYICTPAGGLWKSTDAGTNWTVLTDNLPAIGASGLAIDPTNTDRLYLATGDGDGGDTYSFGVLKSTDGGLTWETTSLIFDFPQEVRCNAIKIAPTNPNKIFVATNNGLFTSLDGAETWSLTLPANIRDIALKPGNPDVVYASGKRFYRSTDGGINFQPTTAGVPSQSAVNRLAIAVTATNPNLVYMVAGSNEDSGFYGFYKSEDSGQSFTLQSNTPNILTYSEIGEGEGGQSWYDLAITASPTDENQVFVGGINVWRSDNGGIDWDIVSHWTYPSTIGYTHADIHALEHYGNKLYCGSDGGIFSSSDDGDTWQDLSSGLQISQYYRIAISTTDPNLILTASQDNGTNLFEGTSYTHLLGGDGNMAVIDYSNDQIMYSSYPSGNFQRSTNGGNTFESFIQGIDETGAWVTPLRLHPENPEILYAAFENVWRKSGENPWVKISDFPISGTLLALCLAPSNPDVIYTSTYGSIMKTVDGGSFWTNISAALPNLTITAIEVHPQNPDELWITMSGYEADSKVFHSTDGGQNWENITFNLPNIPVNCVAYQLGSNDGIYIGTDAGVFYKDDMNLNWIPYNDGLPQVIINQIVFQYQTSKVLLATYGRGVWQNDFFDGSNLLPVANFSGDKSLICAGDSVTYTNLSINFTDSLLWTFEGGTPTQSSENNPVVTYNQAGEYYAKLWIANPNGSDSLLYENYIHVLANNGVSIPFTENFESNSTLEELTWFVENDDGLNRWEINESTGYQSTQSVWLNNFTNLPFNNDVLLSQTFDLSQADTAIVTMRVAYAKKPESNFETFKVFISTDCGASWTLKNVFTSISNLPSSEATPASFTPTDSTDWNFLLINNISPEERTANFRIKLVFRSNGGNNVYVDNINLLDEAIPVGLRQVEPPFAEMHLYPNPAATKETKLKLNLVEATEVWIRLHDVSGKIVRNIFSGRLNAGSQSLTIPLSGLAAGPYTISISSEYHTIGKQLIIE